MRFKFLPGRKFTAKLPNCFREDNKSWAGLLYRFLSKECPPHYHYRVVFMLSFAVYNAEREGFEPPVPISKYT